MRRRLREAFDWQNADFDELIEYANDHWDDFHDREIMKEMLVYEAENEDYLMVLHLAKALNASDADFFMYDRSRGTLEEPTPIESEDDLREYFEYYVVESTSRKRRIKRNRCR